MCAKSAVNLISLLFHFYEYSILSANLFHFQEHSERSSRKHRWRPRQPLEKARKHAENDRTETSPENDDFGR